MTKRCTIQTEKPSPKDAISVLNLNYSSSIDGECKPKFFENPKWLNAREAVEYLRLPSLGALRNLVYRRKIPFCKLGRNLRFDREGLDRFIESSNYQRRKSS